jgi:hypothetical protein
MSDPGWAPGDSLRRVADELRAADGQLGALATEPSEEPVFGPLAAAGPRAAEAPGVYAFAIEAIREGYLLHYGRPRVARTTDPDLALLAGDFLYALGLEQLAKLGDTEAVAELADLISACAEIHAGASEPGEAEPVAEKRWHLACERIGRGARR